MKRRKVDGRVYTKLFQKATIQTYMIKKAEKSFYSI